jgi:uncharacterized protein
MDTKLKVVMFTDQIDSTPSTARRTHAENKKITREQYDLTAEVVRSCRGKILKDTGDGHFIEFPTCSDAVRCGAVIQQRVKARNEAQADDLLKFALHIGIDFGEAVILPSGDLRANTANLAARVCSECPAGEVYFTEKVAREIHQREARVEKAGAFKLKGVDAKVVLFRLIEWLGQIEAAPNPFIWRSGITKAEDFFDRENEQRTLRSYLRGGQNCQIVGPRRMGKTSVLRQIERVASEWVQGAVVAYLDLQDARCFTLSGWLGRASRQLGLPAIAASLSEFADGIEEMASKGSRPVLCMDEFEEMTSRRDEFTGDFFLSLRSCGQQGLSIVTVSQRPLSELTDRGDPTSPFYNTFPVLRLGPFSEADASDFVTLHRFGVPKFTEDEKRAILDFAKCHPLALQVACFRVLEAKENGKSLAAAIQEAAYEMRALLPAGW